MNKKYAQNRQDGTKKVPLSKFASVRKVKKKPK